MRREGFVITIGRKQVATRSNQFESNECGGKSADDEEERDGDEIENANAFVINGKEPRGDSNS